MKAHDRKPWELWSFAAMLAVMWGICGFVVSCQIPEINIPMPDDGSTTTPTSTSTTTTQPPPAGEYGEVVPAPSSELASDWRSGGNPEVAVLEPKADRWIGQWIKGFYDRTENPDGSVTLTAQKTMVSPSGLVYVFAYWRVAHDVPPNIETLSVTVRKDQRGDVTRARYIPHKAQP